MRPSQHPGSVPLAPLRVNLRRLAGVVLGVVFAISLVGLAAPRHVLAKGPIVRAPAELRAADCAPGSAARGTPSVSGKGAVVVGCAEMPGGARVLVAADWEPSTRFDLGRLGWVWFYVAPEGRWDDGAGFVVDAIVDPVSRSGGNLPMAGGEGIWSGEIERVGSAGPMYLDGQASPRITRVVARYLTNSGQARESRADLVAIGPRLARRLHAPHPFSYFVAEIPADADPCRGIAVEAHDGRGVALDREVLGGFRSAYPSAAVPRPGSCTCRASAPLRGSLAETIGASLSGLRHLPFLDSAQVGELLRLPRSTVEAYARRGVLPSVKLGRCDLFRTEDVDWFAAAVL